MCPSLTDHYNLKFIPQSIEDVILIEPTTHGDDRGYFVETFRQDLFEEAIGYKVNFVQEMNLTVQFVE